MDRFSEQLDRYLRLAHSSALLVSDADKANLDVLLTMLGPVDKDIIDAYYGLAGKPETSAVQLALRYRVPQKAIEEIVSKDLHRIAITPEWQMMVRQMLPAVQQKIGFERRCDSL